MARSPAAHLPVLLLLLLGVGCQSQRPACPGFCTEDQPAIFIPSCSPSDLTSVTATGPCSFGDASASNDLLDAAGTSIQIGSPTPGVCHIVLTFATGFTYSADVTFVSQADQEPAGCTVCSAYVAPTQRTFVVDNPPATCIEAGTGAGGDVTIDAPDVTAADAGGDD